MGICWPHDVSTTSQVTDVTTKQSNPPYLTHQGTHQVITICQTIKVAQNEIFFLTGTDMK